jgi:hypothetical protein
MPAKVQGGVEMAQELITRIGQVPVELLPANEETGETIQQ